MQVKNILLFIMQYFYCMKFESRNKKFIRAILRNEENKHFKRLQRKGYVLKVDLQAIIEENLQNFKNAKVVANLPYYITTPIIMKLLEDKLDLTSITVL